MKKKFPYDLCVIGGGAAGLTAAAGAATLGAKVALIEKKALGGDCLYSGCIPSKTLIHLAKRAALFKKNSPAPHDTAAQITAHLNKVIQQIAPHDSPERFKKLGVEVIFGQGAFINRNEFKINDQIIRAKNFVLATGTSPFIPPIAGLEQTPYFTTETIFTTSEAFSHLIIVGAGPVGCELAQSYARLGAQVSLFSSTPNLLPHEDTDLSAVIQHQLVHEGITLYLNSTVEHICSTEQTIKLTFTDDSQQTRYLQGSHLLIATGRRANLTGLNLAAINLDIEKQQLSVDRRLRTSQKNIYACGDLVGPYHYTHMAEHQAGIVLKNALFHWPAKYEQRVVPHCTFTDPELASVGLNEHTAIKQGIKHRTYTFPFDQIDRALTDDNAVGFAKVICSPKGKLLGAHIVGPQAGELISEFVLALKQGLTLSAISNTIHIYPTLSQINRRVADQHLKSSLTPSTQKLLKWLFRLQGN